METDWWYAALRFLFDIPEPPQIDNTTKGVSKFGFFLEKQAHEIF